MEWLKIVVLLLILIGALLEFIEFKPSGSKIRSRRDVASGISGTMFALAGLLIWLFG